MNQPKTWLVTGASKGMSLALIKRLLLAGHNVIATTRQPDALLEALGSAPQ